MNELLREWQDTHDALEMDPARYAVTSQIEALTEKLAALEAPYRERLQELEAQIRPLAIDHGRTYQHNGVKVAYRKGARRVTYDWKRVDSVQRVLRDIVPSSAEELADARNETVGKPSVKVLRV